MIEFFLRSEDGWALGHTTLALLILNGLLIVLVGPRNIVPALHKSVRPFVFVFFGLAFAWTTFDSVWMALHEDVEWTNRITLIAMGLTFGLTFFAARKHKPVLYGSIEIGAGTIGLGVIGFIEWDNSVFVLLFAISSSIYIIVRGLTNINDALVRREEESKTTPFVADVVLEELEPWEFPPEPEPNLEGSLPVSEPGELEPWEFPPEEPETSNELPSPGKV